MLPIPDPIPPETLRRLHRHEIHGREEVHAILKQVVGEAVPLTSGIDRRSVSRQVTIEQIVNERLALVGDGLDFRIGRQLAFHFDLEGDTYFFVSCLISRSGRGRAEVAIPNAIYVSEKREMFRAPATSIAGAPRKVEFSGFSGESVLGDVSDWTYHGMAVDLPATDAARLPNRLMVRNVAGRGDGDDDWAEIRYRSPHPDRNGWTRIGLAVSRVQLGRPIPVERLDWLEGDFPQDFGPPLNSPLPDQRAISFRNDRGEPLCGILDYWGDPENAVGVVIAPAWGRTKETLMPLAAILVASFRAVGCPVAVLRFDGTRRRGESYRPKRCEAEGSEHLEFTFSQAAEDTKAAIRFLRESSGVECKSVMLISFSLAAIEGRRVVADLGGSEVNGWISVVGVADLQNALSVISGGVDFGFGMLSGLKFGLQELFGVVVNIDHSGRDAIDHGLAFFEDARRDMARINVPLTWIRGKHDAWVDTERIQELLACGDPTERRLVEVPVGHQLRSSSDALRVFQFITSEVGRIAIGKPVKGILPDLQVLSDQRDWERSRLSRMPMEGLESFWRDYLLGRGDELGMEILTATDAYREFMDDQTALLDPRPGDRIADLGAGTGDFSVRLLESEGPVRSVEVHALDFVSEALKRGVERVNGCTTCGLHLHSILANLDLLDGRQAIPLGSESYDRVIASLLLSYVGDPERLLCEIWRILKPGGSFVASSLRRDADISKLYLDSLTDRYSTRPQDVFGDAGAAAVDRSLPRFLNAAARITDLEEQDRFRFYEKGELVDLLESAGFSEIRVSRGLGDPPQAIVVAGRRR